MPLLQSPGGIADGPVADDAPVRLQYRCQFPHGPRREDLVGRIELGEGQVALHEGNAVFATDVDDHLPRQPG